MNRSFLVALLGLGLFLSSCGSNTTSDPSAFNKDEPSNPLLGDSRVIRDFQGRIEFGGEEAGEFVRDAQHDGYVFDALAGAVVTLEHLEPLSGDPLDSTLFLYGPQGEQPIAAELLTLDDDTGWQTNAKISRFELMSDGEYLVVISPYSPDGRGAYTIALSCDGGDCSSDLTCPDGDMCPPACDEPGGEPCEPACGEPGGEACACPGPMCDCSVTPTPDGCVPCGEPGGEACACPGPMCDCSVTPTPDGCPPVLDLIQLSETAVQTSEAPLGDSFEISLKNEPTADVVVWVNTSNPDEAAPFPLRVLFCPAGFTELYGRCKTVAEAEAVLGPITEVHWGRSVSISVMGVLDGVDDADAAYELSFSIITGGVEGVSALILPGVNANVPYTANIDHLAGLQDAALLAGIYADISGQTELGYSGANSARTAMFSVVDIDQGQIEGIYTGRRVNTPRDSTGASAQGFNTEHSWPQSQFDRQEPVKGDLHHIFPSDSASNGTRSSYDFGMVSGAETNTMSLLGVPVGGGNQVYQVRPERRGDVARAHFYLAARYMNEPTLMTPFDDDANLTNGSINDVEEAVLRQWHLDDPVDAIERRRNNRIQAFQGNRNPFVDWPELVGRISDF